MYSSNKVKLSHFSSATVKTNLVTFDQTKRKEVANISNSYKSMTEVSALVALTVPLNFSFVTVLHLILILHACGIHLPV